MSLKLCILLVFCGHFASGKALLPSFEWLNEFAPFSTVPLLKISFPDGGQDDFAILNAFNPVPVGPNERAEDIDPCIFEGYLINEPQTPITLTGCPFNPNFEVQFSSQRLSHDMFKVVKDVVVPKGRTSGKLDHVKIANYPSYITQRQISPLNSNGYIINYKAYYDDNFKNKFGGDAENAVRRILAHTQHMWKWDSLTTKMFFNVSNDIQYLKGDWASGVNFEDICKKEIPRIPSFKDTKVNTHIFFGVRAQNPQKKVLGKAYLGGACETHPKGADWHCAMMEYEDSDVGFARSLAHELGHNLGVNHDFIEDDKGNRSPRYDSKNNPCYHVHGIMDYDHYGDGDKSLWTTCSVEDLTKFIDANPDCLLKVDPAKPPTEIGLPGVTASDCDLTEANPPPKNGYRPTKYNGVQCTSLCIDGYCSAFCGDKKLTACQRICAADSCKKAVVPKPCTLDLQDGITWICNEKPYFQVNCVSKQCEVVYQKPIQPITDTCMRICGKTSCEGVKLRTCGQGGS